jgi:K+-transporting ATPase ATPase C chain
MPTRHDISTSLRAILLATLVLGLAYPLLVTGIAQVAAPGKANGSFIKAGDGKVVGSRLLGVGPAHPDPSLFPPRPSATGYATDASAFSNRGPNSSAALAFYRAQVAAYLALNAAANPGLRAGTIPIDAVTTSASGVDPGISRANARIQARRIAAVRGLDVGRVDALVKAHTDGRFLGLFGEPAVQVPALNLALSQLDAKAAR